MQSALWLAPIALYLSHGYSDPEASPLDQLYFGLTALFWIGHRLCSTWMAYCTEAYRPLLRAQPVRFIVLPLLITALCFVIFLPADSALPWTRAERLVALAIIDYAWVTWHFAAQHFGALSVYRLRAGRVASVKRDGLIASLLSASEACSSLSRICLPELWLTRTDGSITGFSRNGS